jgi:hypothetical protein
MENEAVLRKLRGAAKTHNTVASFVMVKALAVIAIWRSTSMGPGCLRHLPCKYLRHHLINLQNNIAAIAAKLAAVTLTLAVAKRCDGATGDFVNVIVRVTKVQWATLALLVVAMGISFVDRSNLSVALSSIKRDLHVDERDLGLLSSASFCPIR